MNDRSKEEAKNELMKIMQSLMQLESQFINISLAGMLKKEEKIKEGIRIRLYEISKLLMVIHEDIDRI
jgi:hypothetical protein